jgi:hypothetical protein
VAKKWQPNSLNEIFGDDALITTLLWNASDSIRAECEAPIMVTIFSWLFIAFSYLLTTNIRNRKSGAQ